MSDPSQISLAVLFTAKADKTAFSSAIKEVKAQLNSFTKTLNQVGQASGTINNPLDSTSKNLKGLSAGMKIAAREMGLGTGVFEKTTGIFKKLENHSKGMRDAFKELGKGAQYPSQLNALYKSLSGIEKGIYGSFSAANAAGQGIDGLTQKTKIMTAYNNEASRGLQGFVNSYKEYGKGVQRVAKNLYSSMSNLKQFQQDPVNLMNTAKVNMTRYIESTGKATRIQQAKEDRKTTVQQQKALETRYKRVVSDINKFNTQYGALGGKFMELSKGYWKGGGISDDKGGLNRDEYIKGLKEAASEERKVINTKQAHADTMQKLVMNNRTFSKELKAFDNVMASQNRTYAERTILAKKYLADQKAIRSEQEKAQNWLRKQQIAKQETPNLVAAAQREFDAYKRGLKTFQKAQLDYQATVKKSNIQSKREGTADKITERQARAVGALRKEYKALADDVKKGEIDSKGAQKVLNSLNERDKRLKELGKTYRETIKQATKLNNTEAKRKIVPLAKEAFKTGSAKLKDETSSLLAQEKAVKKMMGAYKHLPGANKGLAHLNGELRKGAVTLKEYESQAKLMGGSFQKLNTYASTMIGKYPRIEGQIKSILGTMGTTADAAQKAQGAIQGVVKAHEQSIKVQEAGRRSGNWVTWWMGDLVSKARILADYAISGGIIYGLFRGLRAGNKEIIQFSQTLKNLEAITNATVLEINMLGGTILDVTRKTRFTTGELGKAATLLGQAGFSAEETMQGLNAVAMLSTGTLTEMSTTIDLLTTTLRAFNLDASNFDRASDVMASAINKSKLTVDKLRVAFGYLGVVAHQSGLSLEEAGASTMVLADAGLRASTIGTSFRQVLARMMDPPKLLRREMNNLGIEMDGLNPTIVGFETAMGNLVSVLTNNGTEAVNTAKAFNYFRLRGAQAAIIVAEAFRSGRWREALSNLYEVGSAARMATTQMEGLQLKFERLFSRMKLVAVAFGEAGFAQTLGLFADTLSKLSLLFEKFAGSSLVSVVTGTVTASTAIFGLIGVFEVLGKAIMWVVKGGIVKLITYFAYFFPVTTAIIGGVAALTIAFKTLGGQLDKQIKDQFKYLSALKITQNSLYGAAKSMEKFVEQQEKGKLSSGEYTTFIERLIQKVPELAKVLDTSTDAVKSNYEAIKKLANEKTNEIIVGQIKLLKLQEEAHERLIKSEQRLAFAINSLSEPFKFLAQNIQTAINFLNLFFDITDTAQNKKQENWLDNIIYMTPLAPFWSWLNDISEGVKVESEKIKDSTANIKKSINDLADTIFTSWKKEDLSKITGFMVADQKGLGIRYLTLQIQSMGFSYDEARKRAVKMYDTIKQRTAVWFKGLDDTGGKLDLISKAYKKQLQQYIQLDNIKKRTTDAEYEQATFNKNTVQERKELLEQQIALELKLLEAEEKRVGLEGEINKEDELKRENDYQRKILELKEKLRLGIRALNDEEISYLLTQKDRDKKDRNLFRNQQLIAAAKKGAYEEEKQNLININSEIKYQIALLKQLRSAYEEKPTETLRDAIISGEENLIELQRQKLQVNKSLTKSEIENNTGLLAKKDELIKAELELANLMSAEKGVVSKQTIEDEKEKIRLKRIEVLKEELRLYKELYAAKKRSDGSPLTSDEINEVQEKILSLSKNIADATVKVQSMKDYMRDAFSGIGMSSINSLVDGIYDAVDGTKSLKESFKDMAEEILKDIMKIIMRMLMMKALWETIGQSKSGGNFLKSIGIPEIGSIFGGGTSGGSVPVSSGGGGGIGGNLFMPPSVPSMAMPSVPAGATAGPSQYIININATDAQSFAKMLSTKSSQEMISGAITQKIANNSGLRRRINSGR